MPRIKTGWIFFSLGLTAVLVLLVLPFVGLERITPREVWLDSRAAEIFWKLRVPRVLLGMLAGAVLAVGGMVFQAVFRNPLASPFTLGTASGASLGASLYIATGACFSVLGISGITLCAFAGALLALSLVYGFSRLHTGTSTETMLLAGVAVSFFFSSVILLLQYLTNQPHSLRILRWLMGGLEVVGYRPVLESLPLALLGLMVVFLLRFPLNLLVTGEDLAAGRGLDVPRTQMTALLAVGLMVGAIVASTGPIGFVGLMVPHSCRSLVGPEHGRLFPATLIMGMVFLPVCDAIARLIFAPAEMPVGIVTALLGGPFFIFILWRGPHST